MMEADGRVARPARMPVGRIGVLDGYRALAIASVAAFHYTVRFAPPRDPQAHNRAGQVFNHFVILGYGWAGVELFFVISGFVILMTLGRCRSLTDFALRRFARLWPALLVAASLTSVVIFVIGPPEWRVSWRGFLASLTLLDPPTLGKLLHRPDIRWVDGAYWSLWVEIRFYVLAGLVYWAARRNFIAWWLGLQALASLAAVFAHGFYNHLLAELLFPHYLPYFTLGVCLYEIHSRGPQRRLALFGAGFAALIMLCGVLSFPFSNASGGGPGGFLIVNLVILALALLFAIDHPLVGIFASGPVVALGQASYSFYLIHENLGIALMLQTMRLGVPYFLAMPLTLAAVAAAAFLLLRYVEAPGKHWILARAKRTVSRAEAGLPWLDFQDPGVPADAQAMAFEGREAKSP